MKIPLISMVLGLCAIGCMTALNAGCASTGAPTTQETQLTQSLVDLGLGATYNAARVELINAYDAGKISPTTWVNTVAPAMNGAAAAIQDYEANPTGTNLYSVASDAVNTLTLIAEDYLVAAPSGSSAPLPASIPGPLPVVSPVPASATGS